MEHLTIPMLSDEILAELRRLGEDKAIKILEKLGREFAISQSIPQQAKKAREEISDSEDACGLFTRLKERMFTNSPSLSRVGRVIYLEQQECIFQKGEDCQVTDPFFCHVSRGYAKEIFEELFDSFVTVDILASIKKGDKGCKVTISKVDDAKRWINSVVTRLSSSGEEGIRVLESCGRDCGLSHDLVSQAQQIRDEVEDKNDTERLFSLYKSKVYNNSPRLYKEGNTIYLEYHKCGCPLVAEGKIGDPFFCNCTRGYTKVRFETLFGMPVHVDLLESILKGDPICKQAITLDNQ